MPTPRPPRSQPPRPPAPKSRRRRKGLIALYVVLGVVAALVVLLVLTPAAPPPPPPAPPPPPRAERAKPPLQADAVGYYVPGYRFTVNRFQFVRLELRPDAVLTFVDREGGNEYPAFCEDPRISATDVHLKCDFPQVGTVTVEGRFLTRLATQRLETAALSAQITVRSGGGETLYSARDAFSWHPVD